MFFTFFTGLLLDQDKRSLVDMIWIDVTVENKEAYNISDSVAGILFLFMDPLLINQIPLFQISNNIFDDFISDIIIFNPSRNINSWVHKKVSIINAVDNCADSGF